jgi:hypothetical protein
MDQQLMTLHKNTMFHKKRSQIIQKGFFELSKNAIASSVRCELRKFSVAAVIRLHMLST